MNAKPQCESNLKIAIFKEFSVRRTVVFLNTGYLPLRLFAHFRLEVDSSNPMWDFAMNN